MGIVGIEFRSWEEYAFALGYLANVTHYRNINRSGTIALHVECNDVQGAWDKEGRIHYYGSDNYLALKFPAWYNAKSAGTGNITHRINSNAYIFSLINDYFFKIITSEKYTTADIYPPSSNAYDKVWYVLKDYLITIGLTNKDIDGICINYKAGWCE